MTLFDHLDVFGIGNEGHAEDRCDLCSRAVDEHRGRPAQRTSTVWLHRWHALRVFV